MVGPRVSHDRILEHLGGGGIDAVTKAQAAMSGPCVCVPLASMRRPTIGSVDNWSMRSYIQTHFPANGLLTQASRVTRKTLYSNCIRPVLRTDTAS
jgi:hypothetical protein